MANTIAAGLIDDIVNGAALQAFVDTLAPASAFARDYNVNGEKTVDIPLFAADSVGDFAGSYTGDDSTVSTVQVVADQHKVVKVHVTDVEAMNSSRVSILEGLGYQAGAALATAVFQNILAVVLDANYSNKITSTAANFDSDDVIDLKNLLDTAKAPPMRSLVLASAHFNALLKDTGIKASDAFGGDGPLKQGRIANLFGFNVYESTGIPANGENLAGFACYNSAIAMLTRYVQPQDPSAYAFAAPLEANGFTIGVRRFYEPESGKHHLAYECSFGKAVGQAAALARIVTA